MHGKEGELILAKGVPGIRGTANAIYEDLYGLDDVAYGLRVCHFAVVFELAAEFSGLGCLYEFRVEFLGGLKKKGWNWRVAFEHRILWGRVDGWMENGESARYVHMFPYAC